jgi:adenosylmethionine-8-amino-7-oxononanoate aminotransferase
MAQTTPRPASASFFPSLRGDLPTIVRAEGIYLYDDDGRAFIDAAGGVGCVTSVGHAVPEVVDAISEQMHAVAFLPWTQFQSKPAADLSALIASITPGPLNRVGLFNGGSEVTEGAVKLARAYWLAQGRPEKYQIISRWQGFHGMTLGATGFGGHTGRRRRYQPMLMDMPKIPPAYPYRCDDCAAGSLRCADELERMIKWQGPENVACFIVEPVVGATMGAVTPPPGYFQRIRQICDKYDVLFIMDEVMTGFGRTGRWFGLEHYGIGPDIMQFAKGITSGYVPLGGIGVSDRIRDLINSVPPAKRWMHAYTYSGHPTCCAVALKNLEIMERERLWENAAKMGARLHDGLRQTFADHPNVGDIRGGKGLLAALELVEDRASKRNFAADRKVAPRLQAEMMKRGLVTRTRPAPGPHPAPGDAVFYAPPLVITAAEVDRVVAATRDALKAVLGV